MAKDKAKALADYKKARKALEDNAKREKRAGIKDETARFRKLNSDVIKAEKHVSWWRR
jgi:hypothetical protein